MKQKRTFVTLLLVIALLCLGIGYATITKDTLTINGSASSDTSDENFVVRFAKIENEEDGSSSYVEPTKSDYVTEATVTSDTKATFTVEGLTTKGDTATITYKVENASPAEINADVDVALEYDNTTWFTASVTPTTTTELNKDGSMDVVITIALNDTPATDAEAKAATDEFTVTITANAK